MAADVNRVVDAPGGARWYRSFYWRIGLGFAGLLIAFVLVESALSSYLGPLPGGRSPNNVAAIVAADVGSLLTQDPALDIEAHLRRDYGSTAQAIFVVMRDGRVAANSDAALDQGTRQSTLDLLNGTNFKQAGRDPSMPAPPIVSAPVQVGAELRGMVVLPPPADASPFARQVQRLLSIRGSGVLILAALIAAPLVFGPARRRLKALERAAQRLGRGDLDARAPEGGGDEIAHLASSFNRMADELSARDAALRTSDRLRRQMLADVSHELRTPLTTMLGFLDTLNMPQVTLDEGTRARYLATIERETRRLDRLVRDLLDLARLENGVGSLHVRLFDIRKLFEHVVERHTQQAVARGIAVHVFVAEGADQVSADPDRLEQVVENLFANAIRHTPDGGSIDLSTSAADADTVLLAISDAGPGIPAEHQPHIFERFYKADTARTGGAGGSGLGLSISRAIVERHGGSIELSSGPGHTVFTVRLPGQSKGQ